MQLAWFLLFIGSFGIAQEHSYHDVLDRIIAAQNVSDRVKDDYSFTEHRDMKIVGATGDLVKEDHLVTEVTRVNGHVIRRVVSKNGKPLAGKELEAEEKRVIKEAERSDSGESFKGGPNIPTMLQNVVITSVEKKQYNSEDAVFVYFSPGNRKKSGNYAEDMFASMTGFLVVDPITYRMKYLNGHSGLSKTVMLGLGAIKSVSICANYFKFDNYFTALGQLDIDIDSRALFKKIKIHMHSELKSYKRFTVEPVKIENYNVIKNNQE
jgi:hypothetical protein